MVVGLPCRGKAPFLGYGPATPVVRYARNWRARDAEGSRGWERPARSARRRPGRTDLRPPCPGPFPNGSRGTRWRWSNGRTRGSTSIRRTRTTAGTITWSARSGSWSEKGHGSSRSPRRSCRTARAFGPSRTSRSRSSNGSLRLDPQTDWLDRSPGFTTAPVRVDSTGPKVLDLHRWDHDREKGMQDGRDRLPRFAASLGDRALARPTRRPTPEPPRRGGVFGSRHGRTGLCPCRSDIRPKGNRIGHPGARGQRVRSDPLRPFPGRRPDLRRRPHREGRQGGFRPPMPGQPFDHRRGPARAEGLPPARPQGFRDESIYRDGESIEERRSAPPSRRRRDSAARSRAGCG